MQLVHAILPPEVAQGPVSGCQTFRRHMHCSHKRTKAHLWSRDHALAEGQEICVLGTLPALGNWQPDQALRLTRLEAPHWQAEARDSAT